MSALPQVGRSARIPVALRVLLVATLVACADEDDEVQRALLCDECRTEGAAAVALGDAAVDRLETALRTGPSAEARDNYQAQAVEEYRLARRAKAQLPVGTSSVGDSMGFVGGAVENFVASYQKRAAWLMREIGTTNATAKLHQAHLDATALGWRADVLALVDQVDSQNPITGVTVHVPVASLPPAGMATLTATVTGVGQVPQSVTWASSNTALATINAVGAVTRVSNVPGSVILSACSSVKPTVCGVASISLP